MSGRILTVLLLVGIVGAALLLVPWVDALHLPGNQQGYEPLQPISFSHRLHAAEMQIACLYCHSGAEKSRHAGIPAASVCMNCHRVVTAPIGVIRAEDAEAQKEKRDPRRVVTPELQKLYAALALNDKLQPDSARQPRPIEWIRVHRVPDFVYFDHRPHVSAGVDCQTCHGPVETMERVKQSGDLSMGWCVNCHRDANRTGVAGKAVKAPLDCSACHY
jgi:hypothetical protein